MNVTQNQSVKYKILALNHSYHLNIGWYLKESW